MKWLYKKLRFEIRALKLWLNYKFAEREAMRQWRLNGRRCYVIPVKNKFIVISSGMKTNYNKIAKQMGLKKINFLNLIKHAVFITPQGTTKERN